MKSKLPRSEVCFPYDLIHQVVQILDSRNARYLTFSEHLKDSWRKNEKSEYLDTRLNEFRSSNVLGNLPRSLIRVSWTLWRKLVVERKMQRVARLLSSCPPLVLIQHDADRFPEMTIALMQYEARLNVRSSCYFFRKSSYGNPGEESYDVDFEALKELEKIGFEIGYHFNAYENVGYNLQLVTTEVQKDLEFLSSHVDVRTFVPHGGRPGPNGEGNSSLGSLAALQHLPWVYSGMGVNVDMNWSDGHIEFESVRDPREFAKSAVNGSQLHFLFHPQYYGDTLSDIWLDKPISRETWWKKLWDLA